MKLVTVLTCLYFSAPPAVAGQADSLLAGLLRADGVALPFARFDGERWRPWPSDTTSPPDTHRLPVAWYLYAPNSGPGQKLAGGSSIGFTTEGETWYETWGQITSYGPRTIDRDLGYPIARIGVLLDSPREVSPFSLVTDSSGAPWQRIRPTIQRAALRAETAAMARQPEGRWPFRPRSPTLPTPAERASRPLRLERLQVARVPETSDITYQALISKPYAVAGWDDPDCLPTTWYQGWFMQEADSLRELAGSVHLDTCTAMGLQRLEAHGLLRLGGRLYVIGEWGFWEGSERTVLELAPTGVRQVIPMP